MCQLMEGILHFDVQERSQLIGEISARGAMHEFFRGGQQRAEAREPGLGVQPQTALIQAGDLAQSVESAAMRIAGEVIQGLSLRKTVTSTDVPRACFSSSKVAILSCSRRVRKDSGRKARGRA